MITSRQCSPAGLVLSVAAALACADQGTTLRPHAHRPTHASRTRFRVLARDSQEVL